MSLLIVSFLAGVLTILAPCVLPLLPIILGASVEDSKDKYRPYIIILSLIFSIVIFSLLLKASTVFIGVDPIVWKLFSGVILIVFGILTIFPNLWKNFSTKIGFAGKSNQKLGESSQKKGYFGAVMVGMSLGPVFSSCSPTYAIILAVILPVSFFVGLLNLFAYAIGLGVMLLGISLLGQKFVSKLKWASSPNSIFKKFLGVLFLAIGLAIISGYDKVIETKVLDSGYFDITEIEQRILDSVEEDNEKNNINNTTMENKNINSLSTEGFSPLNLDSENTSPLKDTEEKNINKNLSEAYFAGGCFWCMEGIFEAQNGVEEAIAGYIGGNDKTANYDDVSSGKTDHREGVKVIYDPEIISYEKLSELYWTQIDPTDAGGQFGDRGFHYTTAMFYSNSAEKEILENSKKALEDSGKFDKEIATKILEKQNFFEAEEYHQDYYKKSSTRYKLYKKGSGREDFIEDNWEDRIEELEKESPHSVSPKGREVATVLGYKNYSPEKLKNASQENIVLFFHATWCPTCKAFEEKVLTETIPENILILKVDFDKENELRKKYNIVTQTSFVIVDSEGNLKKRWIGARSISDIIEKVDEIKNDKTKISKTFTKEELKEMLTPLQYKVTQEGGTEPPFNNEYWDNKEEGIYVDIIDKTALFSSTDKFESGTGWPSFTKPIDENYLTEEDDYKLLSKRTEIKSDTSHLGHVFEDGPSEEGGMRYCINSAALEFIPKSELKGSEYEKYLSLFE